MNTHNVLIPVVSTVARSTSSLQCLQTRDIDEHARNMPGWQVRYDQLSPGAFAGELIEFRSDWMQLARDRSNQAMIKNGAAWKGAMTFSLPLSAQGPLYCSGHPIHDHSLLVAHGENLPELHTPQHLDLLSVAIDECVLERILERQGSHFRITDLPKCYRLGHSPMQPALSALFDELASCAHPRNALLEHEALHRSIRDTVMLHILDLIAPEQAPSLTPTARKRVVDRAREYALNHLDEPFSILELCNHIGASRRKLQYCFQETLGINPVAYFRTLRLNAVRRELCERTQSHGVQGVAARWGFWHLSRFSSDYRTLFGESPSQTLRRTQVC